MVTDNIQFEPMDRVLLIISDTAIYGSTRLQKYGFLLHKQDSKLLSKIANNKPELRFYNDWEALWYGPFSKSLRKDADECAKEKLISMTPAGPEQKSYIYKLTVTGRHRWRMILRENPKEVGAIYEKITDLQTTGLQTLLGNIYRSYPEYTEHSTIRERFNQTD